MNIANNIDAFQNPIIALQPDSSLRPQVGDLIKTIFTEIMVGAAAVGVTILFVATPQVAISFIVVTVAILAINILARIAAMVFQGKGPFNAPATVAKLIPPLTFGLLYEITANTLVHEGGHYAAAIATFANSHPEIVLDGLTGGKTFLNLGRVLTSFGKFLGPANSMILICAGGALAAMVLATIAIIAGLKLREKHPEISKYMLVAGAFSIVQHVVVALSALTANPLGGAGNDFLSLCYFGIHPLVSVICLIAIPTIALIGNLFV